MAILVFVLSAALLLAGFASGLMSIDLLPTGPGLLYAFSGVACVVGAVVTFAVGLLLVRVAKLTEAVQEQTAFAPPPGAALFPPSEELAGPLPEPPAETEAFEPIEAEPAPLPSAERAALVEVAPAEVEPVELEPVELAPAAAPAPEIEPEIEAAPEPVARAETAPEPESPEPEAAEAEAESPVNENRAGRLPTLEDIERAIETPERPPAMIGRYASGGANYMIFSDGSIEAETDEGAFKFPTMGEFKKFLVERNAAKR